MVASLPNVFAAQAEAQRGRRTFDASIEVMRELNERGYGKDGVHVLDVVFNPQQPVLPPVQSDLEAMYRRRLGELGIVFDNLFAVANNPIGRYGASLIDDGVFDAYLDLLIDSFNEDARAGMMCRHQVSVGWDGSIYDCDFQRGARVARARLCRCVEYRRLRRRPRLVACSRYHVRKPLLRLHGGVRVELHRHARKSVES